MRTMPSLIAAAAVTMGLAVPSSSMARTERLSVTSAGDESKSVSGDPAVSADGRFVAFVSSASNLVAGDINGHEVFLHDRLTRTTERVAVDALGNQATRASGRPAISADGRFVAFESVAPNLVPDDTNRREDIFVKDRLTGGIDRVSVTSTGRQALAASGSPAISDDGRFVAFESSASLVSDDTNRAGDTGSDGDVFVHDRLTRTTSRVSVDGDGREVADGSSAPSISGDGRYVGFLSRAPRLVPDDQNALNDAFVHDRMTGATVRVSVDSSGEGANDHSGAPSIAADGQTAVFASLASNLVSGDTNAEEDVFARDLRTGRTTRVSRDVAGGEADGASFMPVISRDGRVVAFTSAASDLVAGDTNGVVDAFVRQLANGATRRVSLSTSGVEADNASSSVGGVPDRMALSADGRFAAFSSEATNLVGSDRRADTNGVRDVFGRLHLFPPSVISAPRITGSAIVGQTLTAAQGLWAGTPEIAFAGQWQRCDSAGAFCRKILGATGTEYVAGPNDIGHALRYRVRAANAAATVWRVSVATRPVAAT